MLQFIKKFTILRTVPSILLTSIAAEVTVSEWICLFGNPQSHEVRSCCSWLKVDEFENLLAGAEGQFTSIQLYCVGGQRQQKEFRLCPVNSGG